MYRFWFSLVFLLTMLQPEIVFSQGRRFFDYNEGLSNSLINKVYQDRMGFIWLATEDGLNRFDGMKFTVFSHNPNDKNSLKSNYVTTITEDNEGNLWVGLINGVQIFNHETETFRMLSFLFPMNR
jgi:ligand-binding sensor domain-containing protein